jgi:hypothetical protein
LRTQTITTWIGGAATQESWTGKASVPLGVWNVAHTRIRRDQVEEVRVLVQELGRVEGSRGTAINIIARVFRAAADEIAPRRSASPPGAAVGAGEVAICRGGI